MARTQTDRSSTVDPRRLSALHGHSLLDPTLQPALSRATHVLAAALGMPIAFVGVVGHRRVTLTANHGISIAEVGREPGLCVTTITGDAPHVVPDTGRDAVTAGHPLVAGTAGIRFYAGMPLTTSDGYNLGTLCVADTTPHDVGEQQLDILRDVAALLMSDLEAWLERTSRDDVHRIKAMLEGMPVAYFTCTLDGAITSWSAAAEEMFGYEPHQIIGQHVSLLALSRAHGESASVLAQVAARESVGWFDTIRVTRNGETLDTQDAIYPLYNPAGDVVEATWVSRDISELKRLDSLVWENRERFETVLEAIDDAVVMTDVAGNVEYLNPPAQELTGWTTATARGKAAREVVDVVHQQSQERAEHPVQVCLREGISIGLSAHTMLLHRDGRSFHIEDVVIPVRHRDGALIGTVVIFRPLDSLNAGGPSTVYLGNYDELTGLPDRRELENQIERALVTAARENVEHSLLLLSIPQYIAVRVEFGDAAAGELLKQVAVLLRTQIREMDVLARLVDDQFAVLLSYCPPQQAARIADQVRKIVADYMFHWERRAIPVEITLQLLPVDADIRNAGALLDEDEWLHQHVFHHDIPQLNVPTPHGEIWDFPVEDDTEQVLVNAFVDDRFRLYAQKIVPLLADQDEDRLYEFLVHMLDDDGRLLPPSVFIGAAKRDNLAAEIDRWVVRSALRSLSREDISGASCWVINVSLHSLQDTAFPAFVQAQLQRKQVVPGSICFELTEATAIANLSETMRFISAIKQVGCKVSLSQFGTSLHSFAYLRNLDIDFLKIDGSLVRDVADDAVDRAVVGAVGHIAHVMGVHTIAEHVEDITVLECLKDLGIDYAQGYAIAKPLPITILS